MGATGFFAFSVRIPPLRSPSFNMDMDYQSFKNNVDAAMRTIKTVLNNTRNPTLPADVPHSYNDKYLLAELLTNTSLAAMVNCLEVLGVTEEHMKQFKSWSETRTVSLSFQSEEKCNFVRTEEKKVESASQNVTEVKGLFGKTTITDKVVTTVTEHFWKFQYSYSLTAYQGNNPANSITIRSKAGEYELKTSVKNTPKPLVRNIPLGQLDLTWLLKNMTSDGQLVFSIDRNSDSCHTPRRNGPIASAIGFFQHYAGWAGAVERYIANDLFNTQINHGLNVSETHAGGVFVPVIPLFEANVPQESARPSQALARVTISDDGSTVVFPLNDVNKLLEEQKRAWAAKVATIQKTLPDRHLITAESGILRAVLSYASRLCSHYCGGVDYIEKMLYDQLKSAIGKHVTAKDFSEYMIYHNRKLFKEEYEPSKFCYSIRRPDHYPEGLISIESSSPDGDFPITTIVNRLENAQPMSFDIDAATTITFGGDRYLHGFITHQFTRDSVSESLKIIARARQFSCFILMIGNVNSATSFNPKHAIIIQNKDDLLIPLLLEQIPTPKAFRDAIESLSPEQQRFAKAFRSMQLESTLFGVCVLQIKPQLEKLLKLPDDSLTKEIQLTQDLLDLFVTYQIPSDLLSYDGPEDADVPQKVARVQQHTTTMLNMINKSKQRDVDEAKQKAEFERASAYVSDPFSYECAPPPPPSSSYGYSCAPCAPPPVQSASFMMCSAAPPRPAMSAPAPVPCAPAPALVPSVPVAKPESTQRQQPVEKEAQLPVDEAVDEEASIIDFTKLPVMLDKQFERLDTDAALHSTIIKASGNWKKSFQPSLLSKPQQKSLDTSEKTDERNRAFDLLDALSRSGILHFDEASFHVVVCATHCFDQTLVETVIQKNINPIEKVERSILIVSSTVHDKEPAELIREEVLDRVKESSPQLFEQL